MTTETPEDQSEKAIREMQESYQRLKKSGESVVDEFLAEKHLLGELESAMHVRTPEAVQHLLLKIEEFFRERMRP